MPVLRKWMARNNLIMAAGVACSLALVPLALVPTTMTAYPALLVFGIGWIVGASNLQATVQLAAAPWVRARALALYQAMFNGGMGLGALLWGLLAQHSGLTGTILAAGLVGCVIALLTRAVELPAEIGDPSAPALAVSRPLSVADEMAPLLHSARHRLVLAIRYRIDPADAAAFAPPWRKSGWPDFGTVRSDGHCRVTSATRRTGWRHSASVTGMNCSARSSITIWPTARPWFGHAPITSAPSRPR
jgi:Arabinose efflux permease